MKKCSFFATKRFPASLFSLCLALNLVCFNAFSLDNNSEFCCLNFILLVKATLLQDVALPKKVLPCASVNNKFSVLIHESGRNVNYAEKRAKL